MKGCDKLIDTTKVTVDEKSHVDDIILNTGGAIVFYGLLSIPIIKRVIHRIFLLEKMNKKEVA